MGKEDQKQKKEDQVKQEDKPKKVTFEEMLEDSEVKSAYDKKVNDLLERKKAEWSTEWNEQAEKERAEIERKASLTAEDLLKERENAIAVKENELKRIEAINNTKEKLGELNLPLSFAESLIIGTEKDDDVTKKVKDLQELFNKSVEDTVNKRLAGTTPKKENKNEGKIKRVPSAF